MKKAKLLRNNKTGDLRDGLDAPCGLLRQRGLRLTRQRREIIGVFLAIDGYLSPEEVHSELSRRGLSFDLSTIYRNIKLLTDEHILRRTDIYGPSARYELVCKSERHHHYLVCENCGRAVEFHDCGIQSLEEELARKTQFQISGHLLQITGVCPDCQRGDARRPGPAEDRKEGR